MLLTACLLAGSYTATRDVAGRRDGVAAYLPADGSRQVTRTGSTLAVTENAILPPAVAAFSLPGKVNTQVIAHHGALFTGHTPMWRQTTTFYGTTQGQASSLYAVTGQGLVQLAFTSEKLVLVLDPPAVVLPPHPRDGQSWTDEGDALGGFVDYRARTTLHRKGSCWQATGGISFSAHQGGRDMGTIPGDSTLCPGRGTVEKGSAPPPRLTAGGSGDAPLGSSPLSDLSRSRTTPVVSASSIGELPLQTLRYDVAPVSTSNDVLVLPDATSRDLVAAVRDDDQLAVRWRAHPGGTITSLSSTGTTVLVGTSDRTLCAYDADGGWHWCRELGDLADLPAVRLDGDTVAVLAEDGVVRALDVATGKTRWRVRGVDSRLAPVAVAGRLVVAERDGTVRAWSARTGRPAWTVSATDPPDAIGTDGDEVVVDGALHSRYSARGLQLDQDVLRLSVTASAVAGGTTLVSGSDGTEAFDREGRRRWHRDGRWLATVTDGTSLLAVQRDVVRRVDPSTGRTEAEWPLPGDVGTWWAVPLAGAPVLVHSGGTVVTLS